MRKQQIEDLKASRDYFQREMNENWNKFGTAIGEILVLEEKNEKLKEENRSLNHLCESEKMSKEYAWMLHKQLNEINAEWLGKINEAIRTWEAMDAEDDPANVIEKVIDILRETKVLK